MPTSATVLYNLAGKKQTLMRNINWRIHAPIRPRPPLERHRSSRINSTKLIKCLLAADIACHLSGFDIGKGVSIRWNADADAIALVNAVDVDVSEHVMGITEGEGPEEQKEEREKEHFGCSITGAEMERKYQYL